MPVETTANFKRKRLMPPSRCAPGSFRTKNLPRGAKLVVCCPKGEYRRGRCRVGMRGQSKLTPRRRP